MEGDFPNMFSWRCAWSDGSGLCGGAVHRTLEPAAPLVPLTGSFTAEVLARHRVEQLVAHCSLKLLWSRRRSHSRRSRTVEQFVAPCRDYCTFGRVVGSSLRVRMRGRIRGSTVYTRKCVKFLIWATRRWTSDPEVPVLGSCFA